MKALKDCKWEIDLFINQDEDYGFKYFWCAKTTPLSDIEFGELVGERKYSTKSGAINNWKKFAELNGITDYKIVEKLT